MEKKNNGKTENELRVITKAKELALHSYRITSNTDKFPKKYRHSIVDKNGIIEKEMPPADGNQQSGKEIYASAL